MSVRLCDLTGHHLLSGVEVLSSEETGYGVRFCLDGVTFLALQDECDGYRSLCRELEVSQLLPSTMFPPQEVLGYMEEEGEYGREVLALVDFFTHETVLQIGTGDTEDWYPYFVLEYFPEHLSVNMPQPPLPEVSEEELLSLLS